MSIYDETSGTSPETLFNTNSFTPSSWGRSWGMAWGFNWGFVLNTPFLDSSGSSPDDIFGNSTEVSPTIYSTTSGTSPEQIYEEN